MQQVGQERMAHHRPCRIPYVTYFGYDEKSPGMHVARMTKPETRDAFVQKRQKEGVGNAVINRSLALWRRMLNLAYHKNKTPKAPYIELLKEPDPRDGFVECEQFNVLISHIPEQLKRSSLFCITAEVEETKRFKSRGIKWT